MIIGAVYMIMSMVGTGKGIVTFPKVIYSCTP